MPRQRAPHSHGSARPAPLLPLRLQQRAAAAAVPPKQPRVAAAAAQPAPRLCRPPSALLPRSYRPEQLPPSAPQTLLALGFTPGSVRDVIRLDALARSLRAGVRAVAVGQSTAAVTRHAGPATTPDKGAGAPDQGGAAAGSRAWAYRDRNFATLRGFVGALDSRTVGIVLDWYWLQSNYYKAAYGTTWLGDKARAAFAGVPELAFMVLPYDRDSQLMARMVEQDGPALAAHGLAVSDVSAATADALHPLVVSTARAAATDEVLRETDAVQRERYWRGDTPFCVVHRAGADWRAALAGVLRGAG